MEPLLEQFHPSGKISPSILHEKPTFSILYYHFFKISTSVLLFYNPLYLNNNFF